MASAAMAEPMMPLSTATQCQTRGRPKSAVTSWNSKESRAAKKPCQAMIASTITDSSSANRLSVGTQVGAMSSMELTTMFSSRRNTAGSATKNVAASSNSISS